MGMENIGKLAGIWPLSIARTGMCVAVEYGYSKCDGEYDECHGGKSSGSAVASGQEVVGQDSKVVRKYS